MSVTETPPSVTHEEHSHPPRVGFFAANNIVLHVEHPQDKNIDLPKFVADLWNTKRLKGKVEYQLNAETIPSIPSAAVDKQIKLTSLISLLVAIPAAESVEDAEGDPHKAEIENDKQLLGLIDLLNSPPTELPPIGDGEPPDGEPPVINLKVVTPNWLFSSMNHTIGHPSPGGRPCHVTTLPNPAADRVDTATKDLVDRAVNKHAPHAVRGLAKDGGKAPASRVNVVILDTAPPRLDKDPLKNEAMLRDLCDPDPKKKAKFPKQNLLYELLDANNKKLHIFHAAANNINLPPTIDEVDDPETDYYYANKDQYNVGDHGLFIAGIIHSLAPEAHIYLVEVINQYGIGTIESIVQGIKLVTETETVISNAEKQNTPVIVNCSFGIGFLNSQELTEELKKQGIDFTIPSPEPDPDPEQTLKEFDLLKTALQRFDTAFSKSRIFAAAGNDGAHDPATPRPQAYFPAAFKFVRGVGAVDSDGLNPSSPKRVWYSNLSDVEPLDGVLVYGGGMIPAATQTDPNKTNDADGILGIYLGEFPDKQPNTNGWAYWSGTSFATARMSGMFARAAGKGRDVKPRLRTAPQNPDLDEDFKAQNNGRVSDRGEPILPGK